MFHVFKDYETLDENGELIELSGEEGYLSDIVSKLGGEGREKLVKHLGYEEDPTNDQLKADLLKVLQMQNNWEVRELKRDLDDLVEGTNTLLSEKLVVPTDEELQDYLNRIKAKDEEERGSVFYEMFKEAGYTGDEDTFYEEIFPDSDRSEMDLFSKILRGEEEGGLKLDIASKMKDPWNALSFAESLSSDVVNDDDEPATNPFTFLDKYSSEYKFYSFELISNRKSNIIDKFNEYSIETNNDIITIAGPEPFNADECVPPTFCAATILRA